MPCYPSPQELKIIYAKREASIRRLRKKGEVSVDDLNDLDRLGRFRVADELWAWCSQSTKTALLGDAHAHVRSAASLRAAGR